ncbi:hypothetical protein [uncultured Desulfosarcina sp.]|uniref:hypothetical protein n=1 Tax=uncultured Desulfosarcina sp. TaxID=218289 RepID=UPI0029C67362|nr:hypothetical protein [uncultured Desulfosarcina sp.]
MFNHKFSRAVLVLLALLLLFPTVSVLADSSYVSLSIDGTSRDIGSGTIYLEGSFSVSNGIGHYWASGSYYTVDLATETITNMGAPSSVLSNGYGDPFGLYDATSNAFYAATYYNEGSSYIYKYDYATETWSEGVETVNLYSGAIYDGNIYVSGLREPWSGGYDTNYISLFDVEAGISYALIETGGASASVALDNVGNVYYATYGTNELYRWSADQVEGVMEDLANGIEDTYLTLDDGEKLSDLPGGGNGITVDDAGNVFVTTNGSAGNLLLMWNGESGDEDNYTILGEAPEDEYMAWYGFMDIEGDFTLGDSLYLSAAYGGCITEITAAPVPVPAAIWLLGSGLLGLIGIRRHSNA